MVKYLLSLLNYVLSTTKNIEVDEALRSRNEILLSLRTNLLQAQNRMKQLYDHNHTDQEFSMSDLVYVKLHPYNQLTERVAKHTKLFFRYFGPYEVLERVGEVTYRVELPDYCHIYNAFHVSLLKEKLSHVDVQGWESPTISASFGLLYLTMASLLGTRKRGELKQFHVAQTGLPRLMVTWELEFHVASMQLNQ